MKLTIDTDKHTLTSEIEGEERTVALHTPEAFELISHAWLKVGWSQRYSYTFSWMGRPMIQLPEDVIRVQEVIHQVEPDVIVETGVAHGGSLIYYASLCKAMERGRVIGVDIEIREHNRQAIETHEMAPYITLVEGNSIQESTVAHVRSLVAPGEVVLVILDSSHTRLHVSAELEAYCDLVAPGSYIVATDGIMKDLHDVPGGGPSWKQDNPANAAVEFALNHPEFVLEQPRWPFNESNLDKNVTHWPQAWLRRK